MPITLYGIKNCSTMTKARAWLDARGIDYVFHDYKTSGLDAARLERWCRDLGWESVLNRAGNTFRKLPEQTRQALDEPTAQRLMLAQPSMIKRPVLELADRLIIGFNPETYARSLSQPDM